MENQKQITKNNKLIAEFMNYTIRENNKITIPNIGTFPIQDIFKKIKNDWNWLMEVVEKIESLGVVVEIRENVCYIETTPQDYFSELETTKIEAVYNACIEFIKWYNEQK